MALTEALTKTWQDKKIVALAGGVGGAKFAHGLAQILPPNQLTVVVNTGDDFKHYGLHISPDLDTVMYTLTDHANPATGWGIRNESWQMVSMLTAYGEDVWFNLGDRDLATHLIRTEKLAQGQTLTAITQQLSEALGITQKILPATNDPLATIVETKELGKLGFQEYFVKHRWQPTVTGLEYQGQAQAQITPDVKLAFEEADLIVICPSNPLLSIAPILAVQEIREKLETRTVPSLLISPLIGGKAVKGPTDKLMHELGLDNSQVGIADFYNGLIDILVIDEGDHAEVAAVQAEYPSLAIYETPTLMQTYEDRYALAIRTLNWLGKVKT